MLLHRIESANPILMQNAYLPHLTSKMESSSIITYTCIIFADDTVLYQLSEFLNLTARIRSVC